MAHGEGCNMLLQCSTLPSEQPLSLLLLEPIRAMKAMWKCLLHFVFNALTGSRGEGKGLVTQPDKTV